MAMQQAVNLPYGGSIPPFPDQIERYWFEADVKEALDKLLEELK